MMRDQPRETDAEFPELQASKRKKRSTTRKQKKNTRQRKEKANQLFINQGVAHNKQTFLFLLPTINEGRLSHRPW
jgi:hypothetical protein